MAIDYGTDISTFSDLDPSFAPIVGKRVLAEAIARRLSTRRGGLPYDLNYGTDVRSWLNESMSTDAASRCAQACEAEASKDERVYSADAQVTFELATSRLTIRMSVQSGEGPFALVLSVSAVSVELLEVT